MRNQIPTHRALPIVEAGKVERSISYAKAILTLIQHDNIEDDETDDFMTSSRIIRTALSAVSHFLDQAEESSSKGFYLVHESEEVEQ